MGGREGGRREGVRGKEGGRGEGEGEGRREEGGRKEGGRRDGEGRREQRRKGDRVKNKRSYVIIEIVAIYTKCVAEILGIGGTVYSNAHTPMQPDTHTPIHTYVSHLLMHPINYKVVCVCMYRQPTLVPTSLSIVHRAFEVRKHMRQQYVKMRTVQPAVHCVYV